MSEATSGIANLSIFWWLNAPLRKGAGKIITLKDLDELGEDFSSKTLQLSLEKTWDQGSHEFPRHQKSRTIAVDQSTKHSLLLAAAKTFCWSLLAGVIPRLFLIGFTYTQPFLINTLINHIDSRDNVSSSNVGYTLIAAYVLVFFGAAVSESSNCWILGLMDS
jgi:hypothetical protein